jgi:hypothetical protein
MTKEFLQKTADEYREALAKALHLQKILFEQGYIIEFEFPEEPPTEQGASEVKIYKKMEDCL